MTQTPVDMPKERDGDEACQVAVDAPPGQHLAVPVPYGERFVDRVIAVLGTWQCALGGSIVVLLWILLTALGSYLNWFLPVPFYVMNLALATLIVFLGIFSAPLILRRLRQLEDRGNQDADDILHELYLVDNKLIIALHTGDVRYEQMLAFLGRLERKLIDMDDTLSAMQSQQQQAQPRLRKKKVEEEDD